MPEDCSAYTCQVDTQPFVTADSRTHKAEHDWSLNLTIGGITFFDLRRSFNLRTSYSTTYSADLYKYIAGQAYPCNLTSSGSISPSFSEAITGTATQIMYADIENNVYLLRHHSEVISSSCTHQNPFHYLQPYGAGDSVAYFITLNKTVTISYELNINGKIVWSKAKAPVTSTHKPQPIVWPMPGSKSMFFLGAEEYAWLNETFFYWYNDPSDVGYAPCYTGFISGLGDGTLTGYSKAVADGGKDFFYAPWLRNFAFQGVSIFHQVIGLEADRRFYNILGGKLSESCAAPFSDGVDVSLWTSDAIIGNYIKFADLDFYSFYIKDLGAATGVVRQLGNQAITDKFEAYFEDAKLYYPIGVV